MEARLTTTNVVVGSVDFKERFVYLASTIHRRYSCMYIYIYRKNIHNSNVYYRIDDEERRSRIGIQLQKPSGTKYVCVCVRAPGARLLTTFSFDLRHALHLWQRGNVFRVFQETSRYPHASNTRLEECPSPSTISNVLFGRMVERDGFLNAWNRSS